MENQGFNISMGTPHLCCDKNNPSFSMLEMFEIYYVDLWTFKNHPRILKTAHSRFMPKKKSCMSLFIVPHFILTLDFVLLLAYICSQLNQLNEGKGNFKSIPLNQTGNDLIGLRLVQLSKISELKLLA